MKILHITTSDSGGAGIAAKRIHFGLLDSGVNSKLLVLSNPKDKREIFAFRSLIVRKILDRTLKSFTFFLPQNLKLLNQTSGVKGDFEIFTTPLTLYKVEEHPLVQEADIIHLHWISNFINYPTFFSTLGKNKKFVWTFHDMNPFMGGFHYQGDYQANPHLLPIENVIREIKYKSYLNIPDSNMHVIYLNKWMKEKSEEYKTFSRFPSSIIPNGLDSESFKPFTKDTSRESLGIPLTTKVLMFGCQAIRIKRKGFDLLSDALKIILNKSDVQLTLLTIGESLPDMDLHRNVKVIELGYVSDLKKLRMAYSASDFFILPSLEDNLPNVMLESWACGTPVISFANGGMKDHIKNGMNGYLITDLTAVALAERIEFALINIGPEAKAVSAYALATFDDKKICERIKTEVYGTFNL